MQILLFIAVLVIGCFLGFIIKPKAKFDYRLAIAYIVVALLFRINAALVNFANIQDAAL